MCDLTMTAFDLAFRHRNPVIVLGDAVMGQMMETLRLPAAERPPVDTRAWAVQGNAETRRNLITSIFLNAPMQEEHNRRLQAKYEAMQADALCETYLTDDAEIVVTGYGISSRIARSAVDALRQQGIRAGLFRPITLYPFPTRQLQQVTDGKPVVVVELSCGQYRDDVAFQLGVPAGSLTLVNRMGGILVTVEQVVAAVLARLRGDPSPAPAAPAEASATDWTPTCHPPAVP
jgi:2-oxoisovalerate ferredoxin oxidoreductase alpha subunit